MNTKELIGVVRDKLFEYQKDPLSDLYLINMLEEAYRSVYQHIVRSNSTLFAQEHPLQIYAGQTMYDLPKNLMGKRVEAVFIPLPPQESYDPWGWFRLKKVDFKQSSRLQTNRIRTNYPAAWSQLNNKIYFFPNPLISYMTRLIISRKLVRLGVLSGKIVELNNDEIVLDEFNDERLEEYVGDDNKAFISISDGQTGEVKALFHYSAATPTTNTITLAAPATRTQYDGMPITALPGVNWSDLEIAVDDLVTVGFTTGKPITSEEFDYILINWAVLSCRGSLNEDDREAMNALKLQIQAMTGDLTGRELGIVKTRTSYTQPSLGLRRDRR